MSENINLSNENQVQIKLLQKRIAELEGLLVDNNSLLHITKSQLYEAIKRVEEADEALQIRRQLGNFGLLTLIRFSVKEYIKHKIPGFFRMLKRINGTNKLQKHLLNTYTAPTEEELTQQRETKFQDEVKISILTDVHNCEILFLEQMIESVIAQSYRNWELCIVDCSDKKHRKIENICKNYSKRNNKIKYKKILHNQGEAENLNICIGFATGDYIAIIKQTDLLAPDALFETVSVINKSKAQVIYSDEDTILARNQGYNNPLYKPDYAPDYLRGYNYIGNLFIVSKEIIDKIGFMRPDYKYAHVYDFILRATEQTKNIHHISKTLYHRREQSINENTALSVVEAEKKAISSHLERMKLNGNTEAMEAFGTYRIRYVLNCKPLISIIIPNKDHIDDLDRCLNSMREKTTYENYEIIIVENNSNKSGTFDYYSSLKNDERIKIITYSGEFNYSKINNYGAEIARGEYYVFLNNDTEIISENWLEEMLGYAQRNDVGAVGAKLYYRDFKVQHAGVLVGLGNLLTVAHVCYKEFTKDDSGYMNRLQTTQNYSAVTAACVMVRKDVFLEVDGFHDGYAIAFNDVDFCMKIRDKGYLVVWTPFCELYHHEQSTRGFTDTPEKIVKEAQERKLLEKRWKHYWQEGDPYYNTNFERDNPNYSVTTNNTEYKTDNASDVIEDASVSSAEDFAVSLSKETSVKTDLENMTTEGKLNIYLDYDNYERATQVIKHKCSLNPRKSYTDGLTIIILNLNKPELIIPLLKSLIKAKREFKKDNINIEIIVGDTGSNDEKVLKAYKEMSNEVIVKYDLEYNFSKCNNILFSEFCSFNKVLFLNNDIIFNNAYENIKLMIEQNGKTNIAITGAYLLYPDKCVQHIGVEFFKTGEAKALPYHPKHRETMNIPRIGYNVTVPAVTGACLLICSEVFISAGGFDEGYQEECQDISLCLAARRLGYYTNIAYAGNIVHIENATRPKNSENWEDRRRFLRKWKSLIEVL